MPFDTSALRHRCTPNAWKALGLGAVGVVIALVGVFMSVQGVRRLSAGSWGSALLLLVCGALIALAAIAGVAWAIRSIIERSELRVYDRGVSYVARGRTTEVPYSEIASVQLRWRAAAELRPLEPWWRSANGAGDDSMWLALHGAEHKTIEFDTATHDGLSRDLMRHVRDAVSVELLPAFRARIERGETLTMGALAIDAEGISDFAERVSWRAVKSFCVQEDQLVFTLHDGSEKRVLVYGVPNGHAAILLASERIS
jgi:hypothetical protein